MGILLVLLFVTFYGLKGKEILRFPFAPWNLTILVWSFVLLCYTLQSDLFPLKDNFYIALSIWILMFYISCKKGFGSYGDYQTIDLYTINTKILFSFYAVALIFLPLYARAYLSVVGGFSLENLQDIRQTAVEGDITLGLLSFVPSLCKALLLIELYRLGSNTKKYLLLALSLNIIAALVIMEKGYLCFIFTVSLFFFFQKGYISRKILLLLFVVFFFILVVFNQLRSGNDSSTSVWSFMSLYIVSPSVAFTTIEGGSGLYFGSHTLRFFYAVLHAIGLAQAPESNWYEPVNVPIRTNVFTTLEPYYYDFGYFGVLIFAIIVGSIIGYFYRKYKCENKPIFTCLYAYFMYFLIFQFFQEWFFISMSTTIQIFFFIYIVSINSKRI